MKVVTFSTILILALSLVGFVPLSGSKIPVDATVTVTSIVRVPTAINITATFVYQTAGTYRIPVLAVNATLFVWGNGLTGVLTGQQLTFVASWGPTAICVTNSQGECFFLFNMPPLGGANTVTAIYNGNEYFSSCAATKVV
jgi:hypothetical protein